MECINLIFQYPGMAFSLFNKLSRFFNACYHDQVDLLHMELPFDASKRLLLEPVIQTLSMLFDSKYPDRYETSFGRVFAEQDRLRQSEDFKLTQKIYDHFRKADD